jgi:hypothetical protein
VLVGDHQPHPGQAALLQIGQKAALRNLVLAVADVEDFPAAVGGDPGRDHHGHREDLGGGVADVQVGRVEVDEGNSVWSRRRVRKAVMASSRPAQIRETSVVMEAYVCGISTRSVDDLVAALGIDSGISKSAYSAWSIDLPVRLGRFL